MVHSHLGDFEKGIIIKKKKRAVMKRTRTKERIKHKGRVASAVRERVDLAALNLDMTEQILFPSLLRIPEHVTRLFFAAPWRPGRWMLVG